MNKGFIDLIIELECISDDIILKGFLTKGKKYIATKKLNIGDFKLEADDNNLARFYKCEYFRVTNIIKCDYDIFVGDVLK